MVSTEKQRGQLAAFVGWSRGGQACSVEFHKKGQTRLLLLAQSLREIHRLFVYSAQKGGCLREGCLFVVQALIKIRISSSLFANMLRVHYLFPCHSDGCVYVYCKQPLSRGAEHWWGCSW